MASSQQPLNSGCFVSKLVCLDISKLSGSSLRRLAAEPACLELCSRTECLLMCLLKVECVEIQAREGLTLLGVVFFCFLNRVSEPTCLVMAGQLLLHPRGGEGGYLGAIRPPEAL